MNAIADYTVPGQEINIEADELLDSIEAPSQPEEGSVSLSPEQVGELEDYINDLILNNCSIATISELMSEYDSCNKKVDFASVGSLVEHYSNIIGDLSVTIQGFIYANKEKSEGFS
jgi:hypothetical protein